MKIVHYVLIFFAVMSLIAFFEYRRDKRRARRGKRRIPEVKLLSLGFFGGAVGALLGMSLCRHKTKHWYFWAVNLLGLLWQIGLYVLLFRGEWI